MRPALLILSLALVAKAGWLPVTGYVTDSRTGTLRPINGLPGASLLGPPLSLPFTIDQAQVCAGKDFAIALESAESKQVWLIRGLRSGNVIAAKLDGVFADRIRLNAPCTAALLYSQTSATAQFLTGLPDQPSASDPMLAGAIGIVAAMELSSDASTALISFSDPAAGGVYLLTPSAFGPAQIATAVQPVAMSFLNGDHDALVADGATGEVFEIRGIQTDKTRQPLLSLQDGLKQPAGVRVIGNRTLFVADAGANVIFEMDLVTGAMSNQVPVAGVPTRIDALALPDAFALTDAGLGQLLLLDTSQGRNVVFVPLD